MPKTFDKHKTLPQPAAERMLDRIQACGNPVRGRLKDVPVDIMPLPGNMFRISLDASLPGAEAASGRLNDIGADIKPWPAQGITTAELTWDSTLHYLIMTCDLFLP